MEESGSQYASKVEPIGFADNFYIEMRVRQAKINSSSFWAENLE